MIAFALPLFFIFRSLIKLTLSMSFLAFAPPILSPMGQQVAGWSLAAVWGEHPTPPLMSLKKQVR